MILYKTSGVGNLLMWTITQEKNLVYIQFSGQIRQIECTSEDEAKEELNRRVKHRINRLGWYGGRFCSGVSAIGLTQTILGSALGFKVLVRNA